MQSIRAFICSWSSISRLGQKQDSTATQAQAKQKQQQLCAYNGYLQRQPPTTVAKQKQKCWQPKTAFEASAKGGASRNNDCGYIDDAILVPEETVVYTLHKLMEMPLKLS